MTSRNCCAVTTDNNLLSLPDLLSSHRRWCGAAGCALHSARRKRDDTNFLFFFLQPALIDVIVLTGIPFRQIR
jgi:hypothetical protein